MAKLLTSFAQRGVTLKNRIVVSPMCQYSCGTDGQATDWHLVHLGSRAVGGASLVFTEATAVEARGRISEQDLGLWEDGQMEPITRIIRFGHAQGALMGIQLAHAGRKAWSGSPWDRRDGVGPEPAFAASPVPYASTWPALQARSLEEIRQVVHAFAEAAQRAVDVGADVLEIHAAHGYLLHNFLSPLSNRRSDRYGGSFANRIRLVGEVCDAVRAVIPERVPLWVRISSTDWMEWADEPSWDLDQSVALARDLAHEHGVDLIDCSSGGTDPRQRVPDHPGYQTPFAERIRREAKVPTGAVGLIATPDLCEEIVANGRADVVLLARAELRDPYFPITAAAALGAEQPWPIQYLRAKRR